MSLEELLKARIKEGGSVPLSEFMALALGHPDFGYYMKKDPLGRGGDFTTAPEISQIFGEMIGVWVADVWMKLGAPSRVCLLECGPGRGTLMVDLLRATRGVDGFHDALDVVLMEMSPVLREKQREALAGAGVDVRWIGGVDALDADCPVIVVGNEFLDALPIDQYEKVEDGWAWRCVDYDWDSSKFFITQSSLQSFDSKEEGEAVDLFQESFGKVKDFAVGDVVEVSRAQRDFVFELSEIILKRGGTILFLDYGHAKSGVGDTFQAVYRHQYCSVLEHIGDADLTAHVDFEAVQKASSAAGGLYCHGVVEQGAFLRALGIQLRAKALSQGASEKQGKDIVSALHRLTSDDQMGKIFKVIGFTHDQSIALAGFSKR